MLVTSKGPYEQPHLTWMKAHLCSGNLKVSQILMNVNRLVGGDFAAEDALEVLSLFWLPKMVWLPLGRKIPPETFGGGAVGGLLALVEEPGFVAGLGSCGAGGGVTGVTVFDVFDSDESGRDETGFIRSPETDVAIGVAASFDEGPASGSTIVIGTRLLRGCGGGLGADAWDNCVRRADFYIQAQQDSISIDVGRTFIPLVPQSLSSSSTPPSWLSLSLYPDSKALVHPHVSNLCHCSILNLNGEQ